ncbi:MAG: hypothetical protein HXY38_14180, partial [Chloroflexi bacterium]|nr:hypothetical protein [Chloroflexota bacterium]
TAPLPENVLKLFSVAVDEERNRVFVAGIMTPNVAILDGATEAWLGIVETGITERGIKYLYFDSSAQFLYVFETNNSTLHRINVATGEMATPAKLNGGFASVAFVDEAHTRFYIATKNGLTAFDGNTLQELFIVQGLGENSGVITYDPATDLMYMLASQDKIARSIVVINAANGEVTNEIQYDTQTNGRPRAFFFDSAEQTFIIGLDRNIVTLDMNGNELNAFPLKNSGALEDILYDPATDQTFVLSVANPTNGQVAGIGGHMDVYDKNGNLTHTFDFGRKPHNMHLNAANGHIYIANGDASVLWSIDTNNPTQANALRLGDSVEQLIFSGDGSTLYLSSRLGGSYIARHSLSDGSTASFSAGTWPIPLRRDSTGSFLFSLNAWDSTLSVYSMTPSETLLATIPLGIPAGSTDRLPDLAIDTTHRLAFAAYPEFGTVAVINWETMQPVTTINIPNAETGDTGGGPGQLQVSVNESANRLFVYEPKARTIYVHDTANNFALFTSVDVKAQSKAIGQSDADLFFFDAESNRLFLGTVELDATTAQPTGNTLPAGNKIFGMDSAENLYWVLDDTNSVLLAVDRTTLKIRHSQPMPEPAANLATAAYDPVNQQVAIGYLITARFYVISVGEIP